MYKNSLDWKCEGNDLPECDTYFTYDRRA